MSQICITWIKFLHQRLLALPIWPSREFVDTNMLGCFRKNYPTTRVVLDCMELFIERPSSCRGQSATFSSYKNQGWIYCVCVCVWNNNRDKMRNSNLSNNMMIQLQFKYSMLVTRAGRALPPPPYQIILHPSFIKTITRWNGWLESPLVGILALFPPCMLVKPVTKR
jgi:hypothetical protein